MADELKSPYPWFGGKSRVADLMWRAFGADVPNYVEPFLGSNGVLLRRPGGPGKIETVNDLDRYVANFWRAVTADPEAVARWADWPVNEADLHARHKWLVGQEAFRRRMHDDPEFFDLKIAGWWVWGQCLWIALCGYAEEHGAHMPSNWRVAAWKGSRGYAAEKNSNRDKERIWFSPHCLPFDPQPTLFDTRKEAA